MKSIINKNKKTDEYLNENIRSKELLVIDENGEKKGILSKQDALNLARNSNLDLYIVAPGANPPVAKLLDYSKYRYEQQKKLKEMKKNQKVVQVKQIRLSTTIDTNDINTKAKSARKFLQQGDKVKINLKMHGRLLAHSDLSVQVVNKFIELLSDCSKIESEPKIDGKNVVAVICPINEK